MKLSTKSISISILTGLLFCSSAIFAQKDSSYILDTVQIDNKNVVLFSDNVWSYVSTLEELANDKKYSDTAKIFTEYWNNITFAYMYPEDKPLPDTVQLILSDSSRKFVLPVFGGITSGFGYRNGRPHKAIDIGLDQGTPVKCAFDGKIRYAEFNTGGYGNLIIVRHFNGLETYYAHLSRMYVKPGDIVKAGQVIGGGGNTGASWTGAHLHFETRYRDHAFDPLKIIDYDKQCLKSDTVLLTTADFKISQNHKAYVNNGVNGTGTGEVVNYGGSSDSKQAVVQSNPASSGKTIGNFYYVKSGDTLSAIAVRFGTTVAKLCEMNGISKNSVLRIGQKIKIR
jgi:murein DD-endopeptidase MepM/ murein hydrolase activator NlpD